MKQRNYPCMRLASVIDGYALFFHMTEYDLMLIQFSTTYQTLAERGLMDAYAIKLPFYNEAKS